MTRDVVVCLNHQQATHVFTRMFGCPSPLADVVTVQRLMGRRSRKIWVYNWYGFPEVREHINNVAAMWGADVQRLETHPAWIFAIHRPAGWVVTLPIPESLPMLWVGNRATRLR